MDSSIQGRGGDPRWLPGVLFYARVLPTIAGWPVVLAMTLGLYALPRRSRRPATGAAGAAGSEDHLILLALVVGGILGCALNIHREARYLLPAVPAAAVLAVAALRSYPFRFFAPATAALLLLGIAPTLIIAICPINYDSPLARHRAVEWRYTRPPAVQRQLQLGGRRAAQALRSRLGPENKDGRGAYVLLVQGIDNHSATLHEVATFFTEELPGIVFSSTLFDPGVPNTRWHTARRRQDRLFLLVEANRRIGSGLFWTAPRRVYGNAYPLQLYEVPPRHPRRGRIYRLPFVVRDSPRHRCAPQICPRRPPRGRAGPRGGFGLQEASLEVHGQ